MCCLSIRRIYHNNTAVFNKLSANLLGSLCALNFSFYNDNIYNNDLSISEKSQPCVTLGAWSLPKMLLMSVHTHYKDWYTTEGSWKKWPHGGSSQSVAYLQRCVTTLKLTGTDGQAWGGLNFSKMSELLITFRPYHNLLVFNANINMPK